MDQNLMVLILETTCLKNIKDEAYIINLDEYADVSAHWIALFCNRSETVYFDSLVLNMFLKKLNNLSGIKT